MPAVNVTIRLNPDYEDPMRPERREREERVLKIISTLNKDKTFSLRDWFVDLVLDWAQENDAYNPPRPDAKALRALEKRVKALPTADEMNEIFTLLNYISDKVEKGVVVGSGEEQSGVTAVEIPDGLVANLMNMKNNGVNFGNFEDPDAD